MTIGQILSRSLGKPKPIEPLNHQDDNIIDHNHRLDDKTLKKRPSMRLLTASRSIINKLTVKNQAKLGSPAIISQPSFPSQPPVSSKNNSTSTINDNSNDSNDPINNIIMPYYNYKINDTSNLEMDNKSRHDSIGSTNTLKDMIRESSIYKFEDSESVIAKVELPSTPTSNVLPNLSSITPIQQSVSYSNASIFGNLDVISFDDNILSRSTSRQESLFYRTDMVTDVSSVKDANIQIYKTYTIPSLKIIKQQEDLATSIRNDGGDEVEDQHSNQATIRLSRISRLDNEIEYKDLDTDYDIIANYGNLDTTKQEEIYDKNKNGYNNNDNDDNDNDDDGEFYFDNSTSSSHVYKKEMQSLTERHKLIVAKQQNEIEYLKRLLFEERKLNNYLASLNCLSSAPSPMTDSSSNPSPSPQNEHQRHKVKKIRSKFLPLDIISQQNMKPFNLQPPNLDFAKSRPSPVYYSSHGDFEFDKTSLDVIELSEGSIRKPSFSSSIFSEPDHKRLNSSHKDTLPSVSTSTYTIHSSPESFVFATREHYPKTPVST